MPLARIVTRAVEESQELAADLRGRGFDVEIVTPNAIPKTQADVELRLEECTPEEALIRAGVLPETNDLAVFIAPGAIQIGVNASPLRLRNNSRRNGNGMTRSPLPPPRHQLCCRSR